MRSSFFPDSFLFARIRLDFVSLSFSSNIWNIVLSGHISDRDPARWKLDPRMVQRRRRVFWELLGHDQWKVVILAFMIVIYSSYYYL